MMSWILTTLSRLDFVTEIVVDTDSDEIAEVAGSVDVNLTVSRRPDHLGTSSASMNEVIAGVIDRLRLSPAAHIMQTHSTNPFLTATTLATAYGRYLEVAPNTSLFSVTRHQARFFDASGAPVNHDPTELLPTQNLPPLFEENSCFYFFSVAGFCRYQNRVFPMHEKYELSRLESVDIDEPDDLELARSMASNLVPDHFPS